MHEDLIERMAEVLPPKPIGENPLSFVVTPVHAAEMHNRFARLAAALEAAREDACVALVADIRFACGDNGKRMQPELVEFIRGLAEDAERLDWFDANWFSAYRQCDPIDGMSKHCVLVDESKRTRRGNVADTIRQAIDQARGKGVAEVGNG